MTQPTLFDAADEWPHNTAAGKRMAAAGWTWQIVSSKSGLTHHGSWVKVINGKTTRVSHEVAEQYDDAADVPPF